MNKSADVVNPKSLRCYCRFREDPYENYLHYGIVRWSLRKALEPSCSELVSELMSLLIFVRALYDCVSLWNINDTDKNDGDGIVQGIVLVSIIICFFEMLFIECN